MHEKVNVFENMRASLARQFIFAVNRNVTIELFKFPVKVKRETVLF